MGTRGRRIVAGAIVAVGWLLGSGSGAASPASFASGGWGFEPTGLGGLATIQIDGSSPFLTAGTPGSMPNLDVELVGSTDLCVLAAGSSVCQAANPALSGPFSVLVSFSVDVRNESLEGPFTLMLTSLVGGLGYAPNEVAIELDPSVPAGLDTSAVPGFVWDGDFDGFVHVRDAYAPPTLYDYVGWTVQHGSRVVFRYDVLTQLRGGAYPQFSANAVPSVVPEPGAALLVGLGLAALAIGGRRARD